MVPTYFRRELRDRVLQRQLRLRTFVSYPCVSCTLALAFCHRSCFRRARRPGDGYSFADDDSGAPRCMPARKHNQSKQELRAIALAGRDALSDAQRAFAADAIAARGLPFALLKGAVVAGYSPIRSEVDPLPLMRRLADDGAR